MAKTVKFYLADSSIINFNEHGEFDAVELYIGKRIASYGTIFKGYMEYPTKLALKEFYNNLVNVDIVKVEFYSDDFLIDTIVKTDETIIKTEWQAGRLRNGTEAIQEEIRVLENFIG